jgi:hypothetical protein
MFSTVQHHKNAASIISMQWVIRTQVSGQFQFYIELGIQQHSVKMLSGS